MRCTWSPVGQTPLVVHRTRHHRRVSAIAAVTISPRRRHLGWYLALHRDGAIRQEQVLTFLVDLHRHLRSPVIVIWDNLNSHKSRRVREFADGSNWLVALERLPPYAPELNAVEYGWSYTKFVELANATPADVDELYKAVVVANEPIRGNQRHLAGFVRATGLPIDL